MKVKVSAGQEMAAKAELGENFISGMSAHVPSPLAETLAPVQAVAIPPEHENPAGHGSQLNWS